MKLVKLSSVLAVTAVMGCQNDVTSPLARDLGSTSLASITFDATTSIGSVGKGDVQTFFGWNNQVLQRNAAYIDFRFSSSESSTWTCTKTWYTGPNQTEHVVVQQRSTSVSSQGLLATQGRNNSEGLNGPNTGFMLSSEGGITTSSSGPAVGSCPASPSGFVFDNNVQTVNNGGGLQIIVNTGAPGPFLTPTGKNVNTWYNFPW